MDYYRRAQKPRVLTMTILSSTAIIRAVEHHRTEDLDFERRLDQAARLEDEDTIGRLVKEAVRHTFGIMVDVTFDLIDEVIRRYR